jgi:hypothetical protein
MLVPAFSQLDKNYISQDNKILDSLIINSKPNSNVAKYYKYIYKADKEYLLENYQKAAIFYEKAFSYLKYPFSKDLFRAKDSEMKSRKNIDNIKKYSYLLLNKYAKSNEKVKRYSYCKGLEYQDSLYIANMIDTMQISVNEKVYQELRQIFTSDQEVRSDINYPLSDEIINLIQTTDSINYQKILDLIDKYPNFSEEVFDPFGWRAINIVLIHYRDMPNLKIFIKLISLVNDGHIDTRLFAESLETSTFNIKGKIGFGGRSSGSLISNFNTHGEIYVTYNNNNDKIINKYRKKLYLEDVASFQKNRILGWQQNAAGMYQEVGLLDDVSDFYKLVLTNVHNDKKVKIYYKSKEDEKRIKSAAKEYFKTYTLTE